jgi:hypothetical protein
VGSCAGFDVLHVVSEVLGTAWTLVLVLVDVGVVIPRDGFVVVDNDETVGPWGTGLVTGG